MPHKITDLPPPPLRSQPATFRDRADAFISSLPKFVGEANDLAAEVEADHQGAETARDAARVSELGALAAQSEAETAAATSKWVAGPYAEGDKVWSPSNFMSYRAKSAHTSATDPSQDMDYWQLVGSFSTQFFPESSVQIPGDAVATLIYETSKDTDGGAWRDSCQHLSWYNEPLSTATRGARREFPVVAAIVVEATKVTIYDGDDPSLPMWMVLPSEKGALQGSVSLTSCAARNGKLAIGADGGLGIYDFVADKLSRAHVSSTSDTGTFIGGVASRSDPMNGKGRAPYLTIVDNQVNAVDMSVLPDASSDAATGLYLPTIAVGTDGGVSVIKSDGAVVSKSVGLSSWSYSGAKICNNVWFDHGDLLLSVWSDDSQRNIVRWKHDLSGSRLAEYTYHSSATNVAELRLINDGQINGILPGAVAQDTGLSLIAENFADPANGMTAFIATDYNTGWMPGDIKGAWLSDTDDTDLATANLISGDNSNFASSTGNWQAVGTAVLSLSAGRLQLELNATYDRASLSVPEMQEGKTYHLSADAVGGTYQGDMVLGISGIGMPTNQQHLSTHSMASGNQRLEFIFVAPAGTQAIEFRADSTPGTGETVMLDNVVLMLADADRSYNRIGLAAHGTIAKTPVVTGAEIMAYSGFSASNYLEQPYNPDLEFGTGDFSLLFALKMDANTNTETVFDCFNSARTTGWGCHVNPDGTVSFRVLNSSTAQTVTSSTAIDGGDVRLVAITRNSGVLSLYIDGNLVDSNASAAQDVSTTNGRLHVGVRGDQVEPLSNGALLLARICASGLTQDQILKIYHDEVFPVRHGRACTLHGVSDAVKAISKDEHSGILWAGTSTGRSGFNGLTLVAETDAAVSNAIAAQGGLILEN